MQSSGPCLSSLLTPSLYYASTGLVNAVVLYETSVNTNQQILLQRGTAYAPPAAPGIFVVADLSGNAIGAKHPAKAGQTAVIYCTGLGAASPPVADGTGSASLSYAQTPVAVIIGEQMISNPIYAGLYQVNFTVPASIVAAGRSSVQVVTSVH